MKQAVPGGVVVAQGTLDPLTLVRIQAGQPDIPLSPVSSHPFRFPLLNQAGRWPDLVPASHVPEPADALLHRRMRGEHRCREAAQRVYDEQV